MDLCIARGTQDEGVNQMAKDVHSTKRYLAIVLIVSSMFGAPVVGFLHLKCSQASSASTLTALASTKMSLKKTG